MIYDLDLHLEDGSYKAFKVDSEVHPWVASLSCFEMINNELTDGKRGKVICCLPSKESSSPSWYNYSAEKDIWNRF